MLSRKTPNKSLTPPPPYLWLVLLVFLNASAAGAPLNVSGLLAEMRAEGWATSPPLVVEPEGRRWPMEVVLSNKILT